MKNPETRKKLRAVLKAAIWGAVVFEAALCLDWLAAIMSDHGNNSLGYYIEAPSLLLLAPAIFLMEIVGIPAGGIMNHVTVVLVGAFIFAAIAGFWQFIVRGNHESKN